MIVQNNHLMKALNDLSAAHESVAGEEYEYEDLVISLSIVERALADALRTRPDHLVFIDETDIEVLDYRLKAHVGRVMALRAILLYDLEQTDFAVHSARLACQAFRETLDFEFEDEDRYVANHLHQLMTRDVASLAFRPDEVADSYEQLFDFYAQARLLDRAEDMLFHALDLRQDRKPLLERALQFYDELLTLKTRFLQKRGLPRHEVNESRREILRLLEED